MERVVSGDAAVQERVNRVTADEPVELVRLIQAVRDYWDARSVYIDTGDDEAYHELKSRRNSIGHSVARFARLRGVA